MEITFSKADLQNFDQSIAKEWIETDGHSTYASSNIWGLNTRKSHGLFVIRPENLDDYLVILSHVQEKFIVSDKHWDFFSVEYHPDSLVDGYKYMTEFRLDPFPTFFFQIEDIVIEKNILLVPRATRLIIRYKFSGKIPRDARLVVRPFVAFRPRNELTRNVGFLNTEAFLTEDHIRFLPTPDFPELFLYHSAGEFTSAPMWYHRFRYRFEPPEPEPVEDLLNPGFFSMALQEDDEIFFSAGLKETNLQEVSDYFRRERERRFLRFHQNPSKNELSQYLLGRIEDYKSNSKHHKMFFVSKLPAKRIRLTVHFWALRNLYRSEISREMARELHQKSMVIFANQTVEEVLGNRDSTFLADAYAPFSILLALYEYHSRYDDPVTLPFSIELVRDILRAILKNKLPYYRTKSKKLLVCDEALRPTINLWNNVCLFPACDSFLINAFWFNAFKIANYLLKLNDAEEKKYERIALKIFKGFNEKFADLFNAHALEKALRSYFRLHPAMIFVLTLPFPIFTRRQARIFYSLLEQYFLSGEGIKFYQLAGEKKQVVVSPMLLGEYLRAWKMYFREDANLPDDFNRFKVRLTQELRQGMLGHISDIFRVEAPFPFYAHRTSILGLTEALSFSQVLDSLLEE